MASINLQKQTDKLCSIDPEFNPLVDRYGYKTLKGNQDPFNSLVRYIAYQQLSGKAAGTIYSRFTDMLSDQKVTPSNVLKLNYETMRSAGLSSRKTEYILHLAHTFEDGLISKEWLMKADDIEIRRALLKVRGIGEWTVDMFLMFTLNHLDVFPVSDLGVRRGFKIFRKIDEDLPLDKIHTEAMKWAPFRTIAALYLWELADDGFVW